MEKPKPHDWNLGAMLFDPDECSSSAAELFFDISEGFLPPITYKAEEFLAMTHIREHATQPLSKIGRNANVVVATYPSLNLGNSTTLSLYSSTDGAIKELSMADCCSQKWE